MSEFVLQSWPGLKAFVSASGANRGSHTFAGRSFKITDTTLLEVLSDGSTVSRGTIGGANFCSFADDGETMVICNGQTPYSYASNTLTQLSAITFDPVAVHYLNQQFIFTGSDNRFYVSDAGTTTVNALNTAVPESDPDGLTVAYPYNQILYLLSSNSCEPWDNVGTGNPPFERIDGAIIENVGCDSPHGVAQTPSAMYFISPEGIAYRIRGYSPEQISRPAVSKAFQGYTLNNYKAFTIVFDAQRFIVFAFDEATWVFAETVTEGGEWFELEDRGGVWPGTSYSFAYNKHLVGCGGNVLELDFDTFTNNGEVLTRERVLAVIAGEQLGRPRQRLEMSKLYLSLETGVGLTSGQGENPQIIVQPSYDGGKTFGIETFINTGRLGETEKDVEWSNMHQFKQLVVRLKATDPVAWNLYTASIDLRTVGQ